MAFKKIVNILLFSFLVTGCTASFTYNHLDWLIPWYVDGYVDLSRDQRKSLKEQLEPFLNWHREEELHRYVEILDDIEAGLSPPVTGDQVQDWMEDIVDAAERTEFSMLRLGLKFGEDLSDAQMTEFVDSLWKRQRDFEEEFLQRSNQEYVDDNADELQDFSKKLIGRLSTDQKQRLLESAQALCRFDRPWLIDSEEWLRELEPLLQREPGWQAGVEAAFRARKTNRSQEFRDCLDQNYAVISEGMADILNQASDKQTTHLTDEIDQLRKRLQKLIDQKPE